MESKKKIKVIIEGVDNGYPLTVFGSYEVSKSDANRGFNMIKIDGVGTFHEPTCKWYII